MIRVGINGIGRIGKMVFRLLQQKNNIQVVAVNDPMLLSTMVHLMKYDSVHGRFDESISADEHESILYVGNKAIKKYSFFAPEKIPWTNHGVDVVVESSGLFLTRDLLQGHVQKGVKKVILSCPPKEKLDNMVVLGVNENTLDNSQKIISNASCTTNCVAPLLKVLEENLGVDRAFMNTVHPATNNQNVMDSPHSDLRRARSVIGNIIPTTTSAIKAVKEVLPFMEERFDGYATRVPVNDGSFVELNVILKKNTTVAQVNKIFESASLSDMRGIVQYCEDPVVSSDVVGNPHSAIFDALSTRILGENFIQVLAWYDNEFGYSSRLSELIERVMQD